FHGTIICSFVPWLFFAPPGTPPMERGEKAVRRSHTQTPAQQASQYIAMPLEEHVAFLKQEELTLDDLLKRLPIPNRPDARVPAVEKLRARGGKIVFVRLPVSGGLKALEDQTTPRKQTWDPLLQGTRAPGIYFEDFPELASFNCPEWSHLSAGDSVEFSKRLVPHLRAALGM